jgi:hypothetical protein
MAAGQDGNEQLPGDLLHAHHDPANLGHDLAG